MKILGRVYFWQSPRLKEILKRRISLQHFKIQGRDSRKSILTTSSRFDESNTYKEGKNSNLKIVAILGFFFLVCKIHQLSDPMITSSIVTTFQIVLLGGRGKVITAKPVRPLLRIFEGLWYSTRSFKNTKKSTQVTRLF